MRRIIAVVCWVAAGWAGLSASISQAQPSDAKYGFDLIAPAQTTGDERASQSNLWVLEVQFKTLRQIRLNLPDPKTGEDRDEIVLYLTYKILNRGLGETKEESDTAPTNAFDAEVTPTQFVPELTLITQDGPTKIYADSLIPAVEKEIVKRESKLLPPKTVLKNSVKIEGPIPEVTAAGEKPEKAIYGIAMWRGVDPTADRFSIMLAGFSNGYKLVRGPVTYQSLLERAKENKLTFSDQIWDSKSPWKAASETYNLFDEKKPGPPDPEANIWFHTTTYDRVTADEEKPTIWRKTLLLKFWRPGDEFNRQEKEYRFVGEPEWIYQPDDKRTPIVGQAAQVAAAKKPANADAGAEAKDAPAEVK
ncbi:MAG: hypothetical protein IAG10_04075 [Planctomycetaceae bacterium]|nr:hypothetical protein [Planctomycetaceae bacterium]